MMKKRSDSRGPSFRLILEGEINMPCSNEARSIISHPLAALSRPTQTDTDDGIYSGLKALWRGIDRNIS